MPSSTPAEAGLSYLSENGFALRRSVWKSFLDLSGRFSVNICETQLTFAHIQVWLSPLLSEHCGRKERPGPLKAEALRNH